MLIVSSDTSRSIAIPSARVATYGQHKLKQPGEVRVKAILTPDRYVFRKESFAEGGSARVYVGMDPRSHTFFAIKEVALNHKRKLLSATQADSLKNCLAREVAVDDTVNARFGIVRAVSNPKQSRVYIVQNLLSGRVVDLIKILSTTLPRSDVANFFAFEAVRDLKRLRDKNVLHFDLTAANICHHVPSRQVQIIDFGLSVVGANGYPGGSTETYATPKHIDGALCTRRDDLFSLGVTFCEFMLGETYLGQKTSVEPTKPNMPSNPFVTQHFSIVTQDLFDFRQGRLDSERSAYLQRSHARMFAQSAPMAQLCLDMTDIVNKPNLTLDEVSGRLEAMRAHPDIVDLIEAAWSQLPAHDSNITAHISRLEADVNRIRTQAIRQIS
jgi:serine/threonine protein kinase